MSIERAFRIVISLVRRVYKFNQLTKILTHQWKTEKESKLYYISFSNEQIQFYRMFVCLSLVYLIYKLDLSFEQNGSYSNVCAMQCVCVYDGICELT